MCGSDSWVSNTGDVQFVLCHCNSCRRGGASDIWLQTCDGSFRTPWIVQQLPSNCRDDKKKEALEELAALMASQRRTDFSRPLLPEWHCRSSQQSSTAKAGVSHLDSSVEKETG